MEDYHFTERENKLWRTILGRVLALLILLIINAGLRIGVMMLEGGNSILALDTLIAIVVAFATVFVCIVIWRSTHHIRHIINDEGHAVHELMHTIEHLIEGFRIWKWVLVVIAVMFVINAILRVI